MKKETRNGPLVSVVIPTYARRDRISLVLERLIDQDVPFDYEIIVVDDGSPEPVETHVRRVTKQTAVPVRIIRKTNGGPASARNFGAREARGQYLLFCDDDMLVERNFVRGHVETQEEFGPGLVNCQIEWKLVPQPGPFHDWCERRLGQWMDARWEQARKLSVDVYRIPGVLMMSCNLSIRREEFIHSGGLDEGYIWGACEDQDFGLRMEEKGMSSFLTLRTSAVHVDTSNTLARFCLRQQRGAEDTVRLVQRFAVSERFGRPSIAREYDPVSLKVDSPRLVVKKLLRQVFGAPGVARIALASVSLVETLSPKSGLLPVMYDFLISTHRQRGWRAGLRKHRSQASFSECGPAGQSP